MFRNLTAYKNLNKIHLIQLACEIKTVHVALQRTSVKRIIKQYLCIKKHKFLLTTIPSHTTMQKPTDALKRWLRNYPGICTHLQKVMKGYASSVKRISCYSKLEYKSLKIPDL